MNERIQELANKATRIVETTDHCSGASESHTEVDLAKFAELIVKECADVGERYADGNYEVPRQILARFGMDEDEE